VSVPTDRVITEAERVHLVEMSGPQRTVLTSFSQARQRVTLVDVDSNEWAMDELRRYRTGVSS